VVMVVVVVVVGGGVFMEDKMFNSSFSTKEE
jgi:hypothetical protein